MQEILLYIFGISVALILIRIFLPQVKYISRILVNSVLGTGALFIANTLLTLIEIAVGINAATVLTVGILGVPGFILILALTLLGL